ncbi:MAG: hypothetical protein V4649_07390 [Bacteroidota bacterium]
MHTKKLKRNMLIALTILLACSMNALRVFGRSDIRAVDAITLVGFGMAVGAYVTQLVIYLRHKREDPAAE